MDRIAELMRGLAPIIDRVCDEKDGLEGWCPPSKGKWLAELILKENLIHAAELGVYGGRCLVVMGHAVKALGKGGFVLGVDPYSLAKQNEGITNEYDRGWNATVDWDRIHRLALQAIKDEGIGHVCGLLRAASDECCGVVGKLDLLHIDGCHSVLASCRDVEAWAPKVRPGGIIILDDCHWKTVQAARAMLAEVCEPPYQVEENWESYRKL